jgi:hypothetical protein
MNTEQIAERAARDYIAMGRKSDDPHRRHHAARNAWAWLELARWHKAQARPCVPHGNTQLFHVK